MTSEEGAMIDPEPTPDDLLVSAVLDGVASPDDVARVAGDPALRARLERFRSVARAVGGPVPLVDPVVRDAHLARAVAALASDRAAGDAPAATAPPAAPRVVPTPPPPPSDLAAARARRQRRLGHVVLSVAAALVLIAAAGALVLRLGDTTRSSSSDEAATATAPDAAAESGDGGGDSSAGAADSEQFAPGVPSTVAPDGSGTAASEAGVDPTLPTLGTFAKGEDLAARVRGELILDPSPTQRATDEACLDDFGVDVVLLGRATVDGEEGLVYVESDPSAARRLWFVDPATVATDGTCRQIVPVQRL